MPKNNFLPDGTTYSSHSRSHSTTHSQDSSHDTDSFKSSCTNETTDRAVSNTEAANAFGKRAPRSKPPSPAPRESNHNQRSNLEKLLRDNGCHSIANNYDLRILWCAEEDPPITKEKLSELDVGKLHNNLYLRHDMHFDRDIHFSPRNIQDQLGRLKTLAAENYWEALEVEFALHISHLQGLRFSKRPGGSLPSPSTLSEEPLKVPLRLSRTIRHMSRIIVALIPLSMEVTVKTRLNHNMFMQELEHGQCDIGELFSWIGTLLLGSCAPSRDAAINNMIETMSQGYRTQDAHLLRCGLQDLFSTLEMMKLVCSDPCNPLIAAY